MRPYKEVYAFDSETLEYIGIIRAFATPALWESGIVEYDIPIIATEEKPPDCGEREKQLWNKELNTWEIKKDFRNIKFWNIKTKDQVYLKLGEELSDELTEIEPKENCEFDGSQWVEKPDSGDIMRPYEWDSVIKKYIKPDKPMTGSEIAIEFKKLFIAENYLNLSTIDQIKLVRLLMPYFEILKNKEEITEAFYLGLLDSLIKEFKAQPFLADGNSIKTLLKERFKDRKFSS